MLPQSIILDQEQVPENFASLLDLVSSSARVEHERSSLESMELKSDGTLLTAGSHYQLTRNFLENIAQAIGMPLAYAYKISPELFRENFNRRKAETTCPVTICRVGDVATGLTLDNKVHYRPASSCDIIRDLQQSKLFDFLEFRRASVSFSGFDLEVVRKDLVVQPQPDDIIEVGLAISNSESGGRKLFAEAYSYRLVCTNGARMGNKLGTARWVSDPRMTDKASRRAFAEQLEILTDNLRNVEQVYANINQQVPDDELYQLWRRVAYGVSAIEADEILGVSTTERQALQRTIRERPSTAIPQLTELTAFELHNRVTHGAHGRPFMVRRTLQELGGDFLQRSLSWPKVFSMN